MNYYDSATDMFCWKDEYSVVPEGSRLIDEDAKEYYEENKERYNINLDNVPGDVITLESIKEHGIDPAAVSAERVLELKAALSETDYKIIKCSEYQLVGLEPPYNISELYGGRQELRDEINRLTL